MNNPERQIYKEANHAIAYSPVKDGWCIYAPGNVVMGTELAGPYSNRLLARAAIAAGLPPTTETTA